MPLRWPVPCAHSVCPARLQFLPGASELMTPASAQTWSAACRRVPTVTSEPRRGSPGPPQLRILSLLGVIPGLQRPSSGAKPSLHSIARLCCCNTCDGHTRRSSSSTRLISQQSITCCSPLLGATPRIPRLLCRAQVLILRSMSSCVQRLRCSRAFVADYRPSSQRMCSP